MKKRLIVFVLIIAVFVACFAACNVGGYKVRYETDGNGTIQGKAEQTVKSGKQTSKVTAVPNDGYQFVMWSDNVYNSTRSDIVNNEDLTVTAYFEKCIYSVNYIVGVGGSIDGKVNQRVEFGGNATPVTAIADDGYEFAKWSDGVTTAQRQDLNISENKIITAQFKRCYFKFNLDYKFGETDTDVSSVIFYDYDFKTMKFPVPTREGFTFEGWYVGKKQVTDENGNMIIGKELLQNTEKEIYAKWTPNETYTYKILMVYVTEVDALIPVRDGSRKIQVNYKMSDIEEQICHAMTKQMKTYLDDMLDGLVEFEVDEYFTKEVITAENISSGSIGSGQETHCIMPDRIPEISNLLENYQTVLSSFSFNDYDYELHNSSGLGRAKYGAIHFDTLFLELFLNNEPIDNLLDLSYWRWNKIISTYIHEMAHTIEMLIDAYEYHSVLSYYHKMQVVNDNAINKLYFNKSAIIDGNRVGISYLFWKGDIASVNYLSTDGGYVSWGSKQSVVFGDDARSVTAIAHSGYRFVSWSDGVLTATRTDLNITGDLTVTAIFEKI